MDGLASSLPCTLVATLLAADKMTLRKKPDPKRDVSTGAFESSPGVVALEDEDSLAY